MTRRREFGPARTAVKQQHIECIFQLAYPIGQRTGNQVELTGRCGHAAGLLDDMQHGQ